MVSRKVSRSLVLSFVLFAIIVSIGCAGYQHKAPVVHANGEELHGAWEDGNDEVAVFRGVPFAAPPIAELRWRAPVANLPRSGPQVIVIILDPIAMQQRDELARATSLPSVLAWAMISPGDSRT